MQTYQYLAVLDFEATCDDKNNPKPQEVIEFPTVLIDTTQPGFPTVAEFHSYVRPVHHPTLTDFCKTLTGIQQAQIDPAPEFLTVLNQFNAFVNSHSLTNENCLFITCGDWDLNKMLPAQLKTSNAPFPDILTKWCNIKKAFSEFKKVPIRGMDGMLTHLGEPLVGKHHSGIDDSRNIASIARRMMESGYVFKVNGSLEGAKALAERSAAGSLAKAAAVTTPSSVASSSSSTTPRNPPKEKPAANGNAQQRQPKANKAKKPPPPLPFCGDIVDIGANLHNHSYPEDKLHEVLERARSEANVKHIMLTGTSLKGSREGIRLCRKFNGMPDAGIKFPKLFCTVGVHPHDAGKALENPNIMKDLRTLIENNRDVVVAMGECGLDFDRNFSTPDDQIVMFKRQVELGLELNLPLFLHERTAFEKTMEILNEARNANGLPAISGVIHCFTGESEEVVNAYVALGLHIGITGWVADLRPGRGAGLAAIVNKIPLERLMVETDCPYLTPRNIKPMPKVNEPMLLPHVVQAVADCYGLPPEEIGRRSTENAVGLFKLE
ncbi:hypothetical protein HDU97_001830 [Phlyctochytrium planicorne]|nr:hypothetical protein HDU97_001830 [Phlyctochytrium planicorne]